MRSYHFKNIDSTSTYLKTNYNNLDNLTFVSTDYQTKGHGRYGRKWFGEDKKDLMFSILIKDKELITKYSCLSLVSAVVVYETLKQLNIENVSIKWPNDVFVNDKKIAGILLESISNDNGIECLVIGVGINVNSTKFENNMVNTPTSVSLEINKKVSLNDLKTKIYENFIDSLKKINRNDYSYLDIVRGNNYLKDKSVYAIIDNEKVLIEVIDINDDNSLKVIKDNQIIDLYSGEISFHK